jgi:arylformamidase
MVRSDNFKIHDITPLISEDVAVFPGDQKFVRTVALDFDKKDNLTLSSIQTSLHVGAHTDAPNHYHASGVGMSERSLEIYLGDCQVIHVNLARGSRISSKDIAHCPISSKRVLFRTHSFPNPDEWNNDFVALSAELIHFLSAAGVILVGIDTPSIDLADDKILESHNAIFENDMAILEGIVLENVPEAHYFLSALPLKLKDCDASPVRAILIEGSLVWST